MTRSVTARAPASIGNLSVGFDLLGLAIAPTDGRLGGDEVTLTNRQPGSAELSLSGPFAHDLPANPGENIVIRCRDLFLGRMPNGTSTGSDLAFHLKKNLPVGSGLGSSASSVVATMCALAAWFDFPFDQTAMLEMMGQVEGTVSGSVHYDNIAPAYLGGLVLTAPDEQPQKLPWPQSWQIAIGFSNHPVRTRDARNILPETCSRQVLTRQSGFLASFVHALHDNNRNLAARSMIDLVAEPCRKELLPGFPQARQYLMDNGAVAAGISGSGPTIFAIVEDPVVGQRLADWLAAN